MRKTSILLILGILLVVGLGGYTGYLFWQKSVLVTDVQKIAKSLDLARADVLMYEEKQIDSAISAKESISEVRDGIIEWSQVIRKIRTTLPKGEEGPLVNIVSYSGSSGSGLSMNVKTVASEGNPYLDIAELIKAFDDSKNFSDNFVSSISSGEDEEGFEILSFVFTTRFHEAEVSEEGDDLEEALMDVVNESLQEEVVSEEPAPAVAR